MNIDIYYYCYNQEKDVVRALNSILDQELSMTLNLFVHDDNSTDNSKKVIQEWYLAKRVLIEARGWTYTDISGNSGTNLGQIGSLKKGIEVCKSEYFAILEGDDYWVRTDHLSNAIYLLEDHGFVSAVFSSWISIDKLGQIVEIRSIDKDQSINARLFDFQKLALFNAPGTLSCMVYRGSHLRSLTQNLLSDPYLSDFSMNLLISTKGPLMWASNLSVQYTHTEGSLWRQLSTHKKNLTKAEIIGNCLAVTGILPGDQLKSHLTYLKNSKTKKRLIFLSKHPLKFVINMKRVIHRRIR